MNNIPFNLRCQLDKEPEYHHCARASEGNCSGRITWEHALLYAGRQILARFAIIPLCIFHHLGAGLDKAWNILYALRRATADDRAKYPRLPWHKIAPVEN